MTNLIQLIKAVRTLRMLKDKHLDVRQVDGSNRYESSLSWDDQEELDMARTTIQKHPWVEKLVRRFV